MDNISFQNPWQKIAVLMFTVAIHDVPVWVSDGGRTVALQAPYGTVQGAIRHGKLKVRDNVVIATGVRFATFVLGSNRAWKWWRQNGQGVVSWHQISIFGSTKVWLCYCLSMWVHSNPLMSHAGVTFISPPVVTTPPVAKSVSFTGYITLLRVRRLEMCLDPYKNWIQVDPIFEFLKLLLCCDVALSSPIKPCLCIGNPETGKALSAYTIVTKSPHVGFAARQSTSPRTALRPAVPLPNPIVHSSHVIQRHLHAQTLNAHVDSYLMWSQTQPRQRSKVKPITTPNIQV